MRRQFPGGELYIPHPQNHPPPNRPPPKFGGAWKSGFQLGMNDSMWYRPPCINYLFSLLFTSFLLLIFGSQQKTHILKALVNIKVFKNRKKISLLGFYRWSSDYYYVVFGILIKSNDYKAYLPRMQMLKTSKLMF